MNKFINWCRTRLTLFILYIILKELDYDTLVEGRGIIIDDSTGVVKRFANYKTAIGNITQIETDEGEKLQHILI